MKHHVLVKNHRVILEVEVPSVIKSAGEIHKYLQNLLGGVIIVGFYEATSDPEIRTCHGCQGSGIYRSVNNLVEVCTCLKAIGITRQ